MAIPFLVMITLLPVTIAFLNYNRAHSRKEAVQLELVFPGRAAPKGLTRVTSKHYIHGASLASHSTKTVVSTYHRISIGIWTYVVFAMKIKKHSRSSMPFALCDGPVKAPDRS